ncbi:MAG: bifunctional 2-C-methyl-D-erythritol 4-phosphate cytidylyltransferase/2-C-methyl-D-erythritol 2,4-cyclodiphosphate synthase [Erythrobacter sp.]|jgi:2-C-methyl-D-erythritol 4-phosphate cytidylyltransferase/2-C-methyl-D-erythritol 2,4-cyclodiphosphate synthase|uniref:bifunctional 2-C-methyl-D-erythritol 4-phosphate cytidylyltransferase/2-C-methyl-D-erythritol 2,4-cyclodiphosphate synthase n=1 Tax=Qipengyuania citrea TaxID=225971 RepID=UPI00209F3D32|nr:bifunctional 2-C-methyl-D-erythritol 4-phosphate cytidylyltransferase/2-C-methyl-D-erythritol 2,4-cyclodiphosphate synthase [Qipengyuania citrea]MCP2016464.1 2-C-methyl-D-erythritol 4-phosphate cytidylyltransferase/2-C-methyl-D-erythritol 2,4-cyclodiphosphate synthase [Qipengyuania citrea]MDE0900532.1 bifunctional 2-C-methyl-D-erythritol 4-phosphate cytidylyltransferase/2-C-methyl-D-erythritol 2,4-cyclodiphosphate synthase [Erythrobacter sp.]
MQDPAPLPGFAAIVVAAGQGLRAGQPLPKQFAHWRGKPVLRHSVESLIAAGASPIVIAVPENGEQAAQAALAGLEGFRLVTGGETRQQSVARALRALGAAERVLIHDAARPDLPRAVIARLLAALDDHAGAIPVLPVVDSLSLDTGGMMTGTAPREQLRRVQTPQAFRFAAILAAHNAWQGDAPAGDDAQVLRAAGGEVAHVTGDERLAKLTFAEDFMTRLPPVRTGMGYDVHRLAVGEELWLGGIRIEHDKGLAGHSDADVGLHAIVDALLGAIGNGDIGSHFPPSDPQWKGASSDRFLTHAAQLVGDAGYAIGNIDLTIICEAPKIGPYREAMRTRIAELLGVDIHAISVKATTTERLGFTGRGEGIAAQAVATIIRE